MIQNSRKASSIDGSIKVYRAGRGRENGKGALIDTVALARAPAKLGDEQAGGADVLLRIRDDVALEAEVGHTREHGMHPSELITVGEHAHILRQEVLIDVELIPGEATRAIVDERAELLQISIHILLLADSALIGSRPGATE